jgi:hypothetical protein
MIKKIILIAISSFAIIGCGDVAAKIANGDTTDDDIKKTSKVLIITDIDTASCIILKTALATKYPNGKSLVKDSGTTCDTFNKSSTACTLKSLSDYKSENTDVTFTGINAGTSTCVIGGDVPTN